MPISALTFMLACTHMHTHTHAHMHTHTHTHMHIHTVHTRTHTHTHTHNYISVSDQYPESRMQFEERVAELASRPENIKPLQNAGEASALINSIIIDDC